MTTRLDRLVGLLDSGATPTVRSTAARQIGGIQRQHPEELFRLLERVYSYIGSKNWDTRVAAAQAFEAIGKEVRRWDPDEIKVEGGVKVEDENEDEDEDEIGEDDDDEAELLAFAQYDVDAVIDRGRLLLGSAGKEYDDSGLEGVDAQARMALQRAQMKKRLGLGAQFLDDDVLGDEDLALDAGGGGKRRKVEEAPKEAPSKNGCDIDMGKLSARERNRIKRKARVGGRAKAGAQTQAKEETPAEQTDAKEEAQDESPRPDSLAVGARRWPFARVVARLCVDLFDAAWEVRHGAGMALREVLRTHGRGAGRIRKGGADNSARSQRALEDIAVRLVCVCTLDRFGDFVGDHVVAPVRETCAQALGVVAQFLDAAALDATLRALAALVARGALRGVWEARHAGLAALRYVAAVRRDAAPLLVRAGGLDAAVSALRDADDDVRAVAAATLLPLVATLDAVCAHRVGDVVAAAWAALPDGSDDLAASAAALLDLLARLHALPGVRAPPEHVPRLFGFLRHTAAAVRRAAVQTLRGFAAENAPGWISSACLRLVFQNIVLEADADIAELSARLWADLLRLARSGAEPLPLAPPAVAAMFGLASTPLGTPLPRALLCDAAGAAPMSGRLGADAAMVQQDFGLVPREAAVRARVMAAAALGQLMAAWPPAGRAAAFGPPLAQALQSGWALQTQLAAVAAEEFVLAERSQPLAEGAEARSQPPAEGAEALGFQALGFLSPAQPSPLPPDLAALLLAALAAEPRFRDLDRALAHVHADCAGLLESMRLHSSPAPMPPALPLLPPLPAFAIDAAEHLCAQARGDVFAGAFGERRLALAASMDSYSRQRQQLAVSAAAALAAAVVATGQLPPKLNAILRTLMAAVKQEPSPLLQARAAVAAARMAALCYASAEAPRVAAADKMVRNLATFVCADPLSTPVFAQRAAQTDSIIMLEMVQREHASNGSSPANAGAALMAAAATASAQASSRNKRRGARSAAAATDSEPDVPLVQPSSTASSEGQDKEQAARLVVRGAEAALTAIAELFGPHLIRSVPRLWDCATLPLSAAYGPATATTTASLADSDVLDAVDSSLASGDGAAQGVIDALRVLLALAPALDQALHPRVADSLPWVLCALVSRYASVRHMAARTLAELCIVITPAAMLALVRRALPSLADTTRTHRRQGVAEAVYYVIQRLGETVLPYVTFLMVPVLGRMSDPNEQTRLVCTNCFAQLLKLVPLEADIPDPEGFPAELVAQRDTERRFLAQLMDSSKLEPFRIPVKINASLRKYQQDGVDWLAFLNKYELHGVLCDDMGLGKTLQTICIVASDHFLRSQRFANEKNADCLPLPSLVVCPPTLISHWEQEVRNYTDSLRPLCYAGVPAERRPLIAQIAANAADVVIMSYDVVRNDIDLLAAQNWNYCILDEGHVIKNARTKLTLAVKRVKARRRLILSGTPVQNNVVELWSLFDFLMPGFLGSERQFNEMYARPILASRDAKQMSHAQLGGEQALKALHKQVLPFLLRRMKEDVLHDLPPKIIQDHYCELSSVQRFLYDEFAKSAVTGSLKTSLGSATATVQPKEEESKARAVPHVFQALQYLRKVCNHPALVLTPKHPLYAQVTADLAARNADLHSLDIAPKMQALKELLNQCGIGTTGANTQSLMASKGGSGNSDQLLLEEDSLDAVSASHRVLIFCQHKEMIERIEQDLFQRHMPSVTYMRVDGTVEARRRQEIVTRFNSDPSIDCLLLTTHVGGLGLNLTGADTVIFVEHDYNPSMDLQAMDRAHRLGQTRVVNVYRLITRNTLEEKIMGLQAFKLHMANTIVNQQNAGLASMNTDQLLDLFNVSPPTAPSSTASRDASANGTSTNGGGAKSISKALEGLEELWDTSQYEEEYNLDTFISSLQQQQ